jgi:hypothetical protein
MNLASTSRVAVGVIGQGHGGPAYDEHIGDDAPAGQTLAQGREGALKFCPAEKDIVRPATHAASRSLADR